MNTKQSTDPSSNQSRQTQGFTWNWSITISEKVLLTLLALISTFLTGFAIGNSQQAVSQPQELPSQSVVSSPLPIDKPASP
jgi:hypothetical protein